MSALAPAVKVIWLSRDAGPMGQASRQPTASPCRHKGPAGVSGVPGGGPEIRVVLRRQSGGVRSRGEGFRLTQDSPATIIPAHIEASKGERSPSPPTALGSSLGCVGAWGQAGLSAPSVLCVAVGPVSILTPLRGPGGPENSRSPSDRARGGSLRPSLSLHRLHPQSTGPQQQG